LHLLVCSTLLLLLLLLLLSLLDPTSCLCRGKQDQAALTLKLDADLRSAFSWNTKQLFVYVQAEYVTPDNKVNQVCMLPCVLMTAYMIWVHSVCCQCVLTAVTWRLRTAQRGTHKCSRTTWQPLVA
jgi:hypothetical protein